MTARLVLVADGDVLASRLRSALPGVNLRAVAAEPAASLVERIECGEAFDALLCEFSPRNCDARAGLAQMLVERFAPRPVVGVASAEDARLASVALRARARDFFAAGQDDARLAQWAAQWPGAAVHVRPDQEHEPGSRIAVLAGHPYDGIAFLADHLAIALQEQAGQDAPVLLLDLATPQGAGAIFLNLSPDYSALDALADAARCDRAFADAHFARHLSGVQVLSLPEQLLGRPQLDPAQLFAFLDVSADWYRHVVIAVDGHQPPALLAQLLAQVDHSLLLTDQSILKTRQSKYLVQALREAGCGLERTGLVVDNYKYRLGLEPKNIAELYRLPLLGTLQSESFNRIVAMNAGEPLFTIAPKDPYCQGVRALAAAVCGIAPGTSPPTPVRRRWKFFRRPVAAGGH